MSTHKAVSSEEAKKQASKHHADCPCYYPPIFDKECSRNCRSCMCSRIEAISKLPPPPSPEPKALVCPHGIGWCACKFCSRDIPSIASPAGEGAQPETDIDSSSVLNRLANSLAFESSVSLIDSYALQKENGWLYLDLENGPDERDALDDSLQYLELRGLLEKHETHAGWVKVRDENEPQAAIPPATPGDEYATKPETCVMCGAEIYYSDGGERWTLTDGTGRNICPAGIGLVAKHKPSDSAYDVANSIVHACGLLDTIKQEWADAWTEHDQMVRNGLSNILALQSVPAPTIEGATEMSFAETTLRQEYAFNHGCSILALYGDDGESNCAKCGTDFKRMALPELAHKVHRLRLAKHNESCVPPIRKQATGEQL